MFNFLKKKLMGSISEVSEKIDKEGEEEEREEEIETKVEEKIEEKPEEIKETEIKQEEKESKKKQSFFSKLKDKFSKKEEELEEIPVEEVEKEIAKAEEKKEKQEEIFKIGEEKKKAEEKIEEKLEKKEIPTIQDLTERKGKIVEEIEEVKEDIEEIEEDIEEKKPEPIIKEEVKETGEKIEDIKEDIEKIEGMKEVIEKDENKGFFGKLKEKIVTKKINEEKFDQIFWDLEVALLENNVAVEVIEKIKEDLKKELVDQPIKRGQIAEKIQNTLKKSITDLFQTENFDFLEKIKQKKPFVICFVGINGSGKTTTIAKVVKLLQDNNLSVVLAASDTFRAAAIDQLQKHADNLNVRLIKHEYGADAAAVAFDAIEHAKKKNVDVVLIDTAGRMHSNVNLMEEMEKIIRVANPDMKIFVGESITGNDCVEQAKKFNQAVELDGIILSKADIDEKGGAAISVSYVTGKPILFLGTGQEYKDLTKFDSNVILESLF